MLTTALDVFDKFIKVGSALSKLPALALPEYKKASADLHKVTRMLLESNENLARWMNDFLYFDFSRQDRRTAFLDLVKRYRTMKQGPEFRALKFRCGDIERIYRDSIGSKLAKWLTDPVKLAEAHNAFGALGSADGDMVAFVFDEVVRELDTVADAMEAAVEANDYDRAESVRLQAKASMKELTEKLAAYGGALSEIAVTFADAAGVPVTLGVATMRTG